MTVLQLEKFTPQVLDSIDAARRQAEKLGRSVVGAEDLFFGLMYYPRSTAPHGVVIVMKEVFNKTRYDIDQAIRKLTDRPLVVCDSDEQLTQGAALALELAAQQTPDGVAANRLAVMAGLVDSEDETFLRVIESLRIDPAKLKLVMRNSRAWTDHVAKS